MRFEIYGGRDPREVPAYPLKTAAHLLDLPSTTLQKWVAGRPSRSRGSSPDVPPLIERPDGSRSLSFANLTEAHVLAAIRRHHNIPLARVRRAVEYVRHHFPDLSHPLAQSLFQTDGVDLFIEQFGEVVNASRGGQITLREAIEAHLQRIERDESGMPVRFFPFIRASSDVQSLREQPRVVVIDPALSFGKPVLSGTNIPTDAIASRYKAGDDPDDLALDFDLRPEQVHEAIRYALRLAA